MKASFRITNPNMLAEAQAGDLFVPLGPDLVECVCALRCSQYPDGFHTDMPDAARFNPDALLGVVVVACRVGPGEPEYYPPGFWNKLSGAAPIAFLRQVETLALAPREKLEQSVANTVNHAAEAPRADPLYADLDAMQLDMDALGMVARHRIEELRELRGKSHSVMRSTALNLARPELASKL